MLIGTAHGNFISNLFKSPVLSKLVGGVQNVVLSDQTAMRTKEKKKNIQTRQTPPTFPVLVEMRAREKWIVHSVADSADQWMQGKVCKVQMVTLDPTTNAARIQNNRNYDFKLATSEKESLLAKIIKGMEGKQTTHGYPWFFSQLKK